MLSPPSSSQETQDQERRFWGHTSDEVASWIGDEEAQARRAEDCAEHVLGVSHVQNNLRIKGQNTDTMSDLTK
jgi:hypothetical protein